MRTLKCHVAATSARPLDAQNAASRVEYVSAAAVVPAALAASDHHADFTLTPAPDFLG
jgi:hypothetical protein